MDLEEKWQRAVSETEILKFYRLHLSTQTATTLEYIFLGESQINIGDTVVRKGKVVVNHPLIVMPKNMPQFEGFDLEEELETDESSLRFFFMVRGIQFPSLKYNNEISTIEVVEHSIEKTTDSYLNELEKKEDLTTGLIVGPTDTWQLSILIYVTILINRAAPSDLEKFLNDLRRRLSD